MAKEGKKIRAEKVDTSDLVRLFLEGQKEGESYGVTAKKIWPKLDEARALRALRQRVKQVNKQLKEGNFEERLAVPPTQKTPLDVASIAAMIKQFSA